MGSTGFWHELKRRHVYRVAVAYVIVGWLLIQVVTQVFPVFHVPDWVDQAVVLLILVGFPIALVLAWAFDAAPPDTIATGAVTDAAAAGAMPPQRSRHAVILVGLIGIVIALIAGGAYWHLRHGPGLGSGHSMAESRALSGAQTKSAQLTSTASPLAGASTVTALPSAPTKSIAVLPFENLSEDKGNAYFADGMQDLILTKLSDIGDLKVISRTSTMKYASHPDDLKTIAKQLGVSTILEGSVQKAGNQVLINVQLIDANTDGHIWADSYTRTLDNIFGVEGEVAGKVADALKAKLSPSEAVAVANVPTKSPAAYDAYLRGESYLDQMWAGDFAAVSKAVAAFREATDHDPHFALAWAQLAFCQSMLSYASIDTSDATRQQALANAQHALALASDLPRAHYALGYIYRFGFADYDNALAQFKIAQRGSPNDAEVEAAIAYIEGIRGNQAAALAGLQRATALNPRDPNLALGLCRDLTVSRLYDQAGTACRRALAIAPNDPEAYTELAWLEVLQHGDVQAALAKLAKAPRDLQSGSEILAMRVRLLLLQRSYKAAQHAVDTLRPGGRYVTPLNVLMLRASVSDLSGDPQGAKALYQQALVMAKAAVGAGMSEAWFRSALFIPVAQAGTGHRPEALQALDSIRAKLSKMDFGSYINLLSLVRAHVYVILGDNDAAIAALDKALAAPSGQLVSVPLLRLDPRWDPIRNDPRFQALLKKYANTIPASTSTSGSGNE